ncbi:MAG: hypothetical protein AB7S26_43055 [Sandaracinaceae bacterium]
MTSVDTAEMRVCWIARDVLYCMGGASTQTGWLTLGPNGIDPRTVPADERASVSIGLPRPVMHVPPGTAVVQLGVSTCIAVPGVATLGCDHSIVPSGLVDARRARVLPYGPVRYAGRGPLVHPFMESTLGPPRDDRLLWATGTQRDTSAPPAHDPTHTLR